MANYQLPRFTASTPPPRETGLARAQDIGALTRTGDAEVFAEIARFGGVAQDAAGLGARAYIQRKQLDDDIEFGKASQKAKGIFRQAENVVDELDVTQDMPLSDDPDFLKTLATYSVGQRDKDLQEATKGIEKDSAKLSSGFRSPRAKARFEAWYNDNYADSIDRLREKYDLKLHEYQLDEMGKLAESAARNGDMETANHYIDLMDEHELITPTNATRRKKALAEFSKKALGDDIYETAKDIPYPANVEFVNALPGIDKEVRNDTITRLERKQHWDTAVTDQSAKGILEDMGYKIWTGAVAKEEFDVAIEAARYPVEGDPTIDDAAYDELKSLGARELKTSQGKGMSEAAFYGKGQLVEVTNDAVYEQIILRMSGKKKAEFIADRKLQLENWSQYNRSMREWLGENPNATESEIYIESRKKMTAYRGREAQDIQTGNLGEKRKPRRFDIFGNIVGEQKYKYTSTNPGTGERKGSNDGKTWHKIQ